MNENSSQPSPPSPIQNAGLEYNMSIDEMIDQLWETIDNPVSGSVLKVKEVLYVAAKAKSIIQAQPVFLELVPPVCVCGDLHGQFFDLLRILQRCGDPGKTNYLFLGDYVDRGNQSINTIVLLLLYKIKYPENFFLLRGNHESSSINKVYGFYEECGKKNSIWRAINALFDWLPMAATIDGRIFCVHAGISPDLEDIEQLRNIVRPFEIPDTGLLADLTWSDPDPNCEEWTDNAERQTSYIFGEKHVQEFLDKFGLDLIVRAHQVVNDGYDFPYLPYRGLVTIFSAPYYCGEVKNSGAVMMVSENNQCRFEVFEPIEPAVVREGLCRPELPTREVPYHVELTVKRFG